MKSLVNILNEMAKVDDVLKRIADDIQNNFRPPGWPKYGDVQGPEIDATRKKVRYDVQHLGNWRIPPDAEGEKGDFEDYDYEEWAPGEYKKYLKYFKDWIRSRSWANLVKDFDIEGSEKNWVSFHITVKNRLFVKP